MTDKYAHAEDTIFSVNELESDFNQAQNLINSQEENSIEGLALNVMTDLKNVRFKIAWEANHSPQICAKFLKRFDGIDFAALSLDKLEKKFAKVWTFTERYSQTKQGYGSTLGFMPKLLHLMGELESEIKIKKAEKVLLETPEKYSLEDAKIHLSCWKKKCVEKNMSFTKMREIYNKVTLALKCIDNQDMTVLAKTEGITDIIKDFANLKEGLKERITTSEKKIKKVETFLSKIDLFGIKQKSSDRSDKRTSWDVGVQSVKSENTHKKRNSMR